MGSLNMNGPYDFNDDSIEFNITKISGGNYALGTVDKMTNNFHVTYVGRSDSDLKDRLKQQLIRLNDISNRFQKKNLSFKYSYAFSPKEAYEEECRNYHDFIGSKKLINNFHPEKPIDEKWICPFCKE